MLSPSESRLLALRNDKSYYHMHQSMYCLIDHLTTMALTILVAHPIAT
jgi:hypothetical protein